MFGLITNTKLALLRGLLALISLIGLAPTVDADEKPTAEPAKPILIGIDSDYPPHQYLDDQGEPTGFDVDLIRAVAAAANLEYEIHAGPWDQIRSQLEQGTIDVNPGVVSTPDRDRLLDFSTPTVIVQHAVFVRKSSPVKIVEDLAGKDIVLERDTIWADLLKADPPVAIGRLVEVESSEVALRQVASGLHDGAVLLHTQGLYFTRTLGLSNLRSVGQGTGSMQYRLAVPEGRNDLLAELNDGLAEVRASGLYDEIYDEWFGVLKETGLSTKVLRFLVIVTALGLTVLAGSLLWGRTLRKRVHEKTQELKETEEAKRALERTLLESQKTEALGRLAGGIAHDFNNILTAILGNADLALAPGAAKDLPRILKEIQGAGSSGAELTRHLLSFCKKRSSEPQSVSWNQVVEKMEPMLRRLLGDGISIALDLSPDLWPVRIDPAQASQIVLNLVINARDAIQGQGVVRIKTENRPRTEEVDKVAISVQDNGEGMSEKTRQRIFEPYFSTKRSAQGTGLGLSTIHGIVQQCAGAVEVESSPGAGTTFTVTMRRTKEQARPEEHKAATPTSRKSDPKTILFVDDDSSVRKVVSALLELMGFGVVAAKDGREALRVIESSERIIDAIITDVSMPGISGIELSQRVRRLRPKMRILLSSGYTEEDLGVQLETGDAIGFLPKPYTLEALSDALSTLA